MVFSLYFYDNFMKFGIESFFVFKNKLNSVVIEIIGNFIKMYINLVIVVVLVIVYLILV